MPEPSPYPSNLVISNLNLMKNKPGWRISRTGSGSGPSLGFRTLSVPLHVREAPPQKGDPGIWALPIKRGAQGLPGWFGAVYALLKTVMYILTHHAKPILKKRRDGLVILSVACTGSITNLVKPRPQPTGCIEGIRGVGQSLFQDLLQDICISGLDTILWSAQR